MKSLLLILVIAVSSSVQARVFKFEGGVGAGHPYPLANENFRNSASSGDSNHYWLGYRLTNNWVLELSHDYQDFDRLEMNSKSYSLGGTYHLAPGERTHPFIKLALGSAQHKYADLSVSSKTAMAAKLAFGLDYALFENIGLQGGFAYHFYERSSENVTSAQALNPYLAITIGFGGGELKSSHAEAPQTEPTIVEKPVVAVLKAPVVDTDGDGIADEDDKCPSTKLGVVVNTYGCAVTEKASITMNVLFKTGKVEIEPATLSEVQKLAEFMKKHPETKAHIKGYTDSSGSQAVNMAISQKRADSVKAQLAKEGIVEGRLQATGFGPNEPIADNKTAAGRKANRRVVAEISAEVEVKK